MSDEGERQGSAEKTSPAVDWKAQLSDDLRWLNKRAWPLAGVVLFIAGTYLYNFILVEEAPLSITSSTFITAVPVLMIFVIIITGLLTGLLFGPLMVFFVRIRKGRQERFSDLLLYDKKKQHQQASRPASHQLSDIWIVLCSWFVPLVLFSFVLGTMILTKFLWPFVVIMVSVVGAVLWFYFWIRMRYRVNIKHLSGDFWSAAFVSFWMQFVWVIFIVTMASRAAQGTEHKTLFLFLYWVLGVFALGFVQLVAATVIAASIQFKISLRKAVFIAAGFIALLGICPPTGAALAGLVFQLTASGGRSCAVLSWTDKTSDGIAREIRAPGNPAQSVPVRILLEADGVYRIHKNDDPSQKIYLVPTDRVVGIDSCKRPVSKAG
jgi:hypothetical protein